MSTMSVGFDLRIFRGITGYVRQNSLPWHVRWSKEFDSIDFTKTEGVVGFFVPEEFQKKINELGIPAVYTSRRMLGCGKPCVVTNDYAIGEMAAAFALAGPYTHFTTLGSDTLPFSRERVAGFVRGLKGRKCQSHLISANLIGEAQLEQLSTILEHLAPGSLLFAVNDNMARTLALIAEKKDIRIPEDLSFLGVDAEEIYSSEAPIRLSSVDPGPEGIGYRAAEVLRALMNGSESISLDAVYEIAPLGIVEAASTRKRVPGDARMLEAGRYLENHLDDPLDVAALARTYGCSRRSFETRFRKAWGLSPAEFLRGKRIERAKKLLREGNLSVAEVGERCGFSSLSYFSSAFHKATGFSPRAHSFVHGGDAGEDGKQG